MKSDADMDELADKLMQRIYYQMQKRSINMNEGRCNGFNFVVFKSGGR